MEAYLVSMDYVYSTTLKKGKAVVMLSKSCDGRVFLPDMDNYRPGDAVNMFGDRYIVQNVYSNYMPNTSTRDFYLVGYLDKETDEVLRLWSQIAVDVSVETTDSCDLERKERKSWIRVK